MKPAYLIIRDDDAPYCTVCGVEIEDICDECKDPMGFHIKESIYCDEDTGKHYCIGCGRKK